MIKIIACIGKNRELGKDNHLVFHIKEDMDFFKKMTMNSIVVMGKNTFESIGHPLKNRKNIVLSKDGKISFDDILCFTEDVWIIGGASVYAQFLPYAREIYLTEVDEEVDADVFFPDFDKSRYKEEVLEEGKTFKIKRYLLLGESGL